MKSQSILLLAGGAVLALFSWLQWYAGQYEGEEPASLVLSNTQRAVIRFRPRIYTDNEIGIAWTTPRMPASKASHFAAEARKMTVRLQILDNRDRVIFERQAKPRFEARSVDPGTVYLTALDQTKHRLKPLRTYVAVATVTSAPQHSASISADLRVLPAAGTVEVEKYHFNALCLLSAAAVSAACGVWLHWRTRQFRIWSVDTP